MADQPKRLTDVPIAWRLPASRYIHIPGNATFDSEGEAAGAKRSALAVEEVRRDRGGMGGDRERKDAIDRISARGERYLKSYFDPIEWHDFHKGVAGSADLGDYVDAKTISRALPFEICRLSCSAEQPPKATWAYVLVVPDKASGFCLCGWEWGEALIAAGCVDVLKTGRPVWSLAIDLLRPVHSLRAILQGDIDLARSVGRVVDYVTSLRGPMSGRGRI